MPKELSQMNSAVADLEEMNALARSLGKSVARSKRTNFCKVEKDIARDIGITKDALRGFLARRTKVVPRWLLNSVRAELVSALELEMQNLAHEIQLHRQAGSHPCSAALVAAETKLAEVRQILEGEMKC
jgi:predicted transcriptional regulator